MSGEKQKSRNKNMTVAPTLRQADLTKLSKNTSWKWGKQSKYTVCSLVTFPWSYWDKCFLSLCGSIFFFFYHANFLILLLSRPCTWKSQECCYGRFSWETTISSLRIILNPKSSHAPHFTSCFIIFNLYLRKLNVVHSKVDTYQVLSS